MSAERLHRQWCNCCRMFVRNDNGICLNCGDGAAKAVGREGMVTVWDDEGRYLGCMGVRLWEWLLREGTPPAASGLSGREYARRELGELVAVSADLTVGESASSGVSG